MSVLAVYLVTTASLKKITLLLVLASHLLLLSMRDLIGVLARTLAACSIPTIEAKLADLLALRLVSLLEPASHLLAKAGLLLLERLLLLK